MEALAAVALAGNVLQFVEFVGRLFKDTCRIYASASGLTPNDLHIQDICGKLGLFSAQLQSVSSSLSTPPDLRDCVSDCQKDCDDLLSIMRSLAAKKGHSQRPWKSFSAALCHRMKAGEIEKLEDRIQKHQTLISLYLSKMLNNNVHLLGEEISQLKSTITGCTARTTDWLHKLTDTQQSLREQVETLNEQIRTPNRQENASQSAIETICSELRGLSLDTQECQQTMNILNSLDYKERPTRHSVIPEAHQTTFGWALRQDESNAIHDASGSLRHWLKGDSNLFWVSGKPGSGKSTFMKFAAGHKNTLERLHHWAGHGELVLAKHFFTIYGTTIQRSLEGLLRSLLHNILEGEPSLMRQLLPVRWANMAPQPHWTHSELESTLRSVATANLSVHMCFFIDGLDEYSGDHLEICQLMKDLSESPFIKVCVSSRPWNVFEDTFGSSRESKLYMHELIHEDIIEYTRARLQEHPRWALFSSGPNAAASQSLIDGVVNKSMGVFLWVFLVTKLLREGLSNDDSFSDLRRRVVSYPTDLETFFKHILASVDPFYHEKMASTLMIARDAGEPLDIEMFMFHDREYDDENYALHDLVDDEYPEFLNCEQASSSVSRRINGRCKGLMECQDGKMVFLHRTVFDFLRAPEMAEFLREKAKANFCSYLSLLRAWLAYFKRTTFNEASVPREEPNLMKDLPEFVQRLSEGPRYARLASDEGSDSEVAVAALLDNAELGIAMMVRRNQIPSQYASTAVGVYRLLLLEAGVNDYVSSKLCIPGYLSNPYTDRHHSPLCFVVGMSPPSLSRTYSVGNEINPRLLETLLEFGHDPNKAYGEDTFWTRFVKSYICKFGAPSCPEMLGTTIETGILETLLRHGADPTACIPVSLTGKYKAPFWFNLLLIAPHIHSRHRPAFERIWDLVLRRIPALSQAKVLERIYPTPADGKRWVSYDLWNSMQFVFGMQKRLSLLKNDTLFLRLVSKTLDRVRDRQTAYTQCRDYFAWLLDVDSHKFEQKLLSMKQGEVNTRKRLFEGKGGKEQTNAAKIRRLRR